ncbi:TetR family transcriptional regulator [Rhizobium tubonense]|uniref:TetR family transcriptional regulator n=2 Tax=Rhizobium tubonense TaxID=484088 RepID=A0A2W4F7X7_9HYPH|nr:TetR/AcrR family transcriptional regulator [Rhizobium tubonense]PZM16930.1 TetR family transcriptional regulator [Rhizobium tubonense]
MNDAKKTPVKPRGRPPAFDRETVLASARETFWQHGYEGASIADLTAAMGITPQSLYAAFRSKAGLYKEALDQYRRMPRPLAGNPLTEDVDTTTAFDRFLRNSALLFSAPEHPKGCMISTAVLNCATENDEIADYVSSLRGGMLQAFIARIERGIHDGEIRKGTNVGALARFLGAIVQGMSVQARDGAKGEELLEVVAIAIGQLASHRA